jgi:hypothetical protein
MHGGALRCGGVLRTVGRNGGPGDRPNSVPLSLLQIPQETALLEICLRDDRPAISRLCHCMAPIYYRDVISTITMSSTSPAAAGRLHFSHSTTRSPHHVPPFLSIM